MASYRVTIKFIIMKVSCWLTVDVLMETFCKLLNNTDQNSMCFFSFPFCNIPKHIFLLQINFNFQSVNVEGAELHNMGQLTDIGIVDAKINDFISKLSSMLPLYIKTSRWVLHGCLLSMSKQLWYDFLKFEDCWYRCRFLLLIKLICDIRTQSVQLNASGHSNSFTSYRKTNEDSDLIDSLHISWYYFYMILKNSTSN